MSTWFLSALLHLIAISYVFVIIYYKNKLTGIIVMIVGLITSLLLAISPYLLFGIKPYLQIWDVDTVLLQNSRHYTLYHFFTTVYFVSFLAGFPFGYLMHKGTVKLSKIQVKMSWISSICTILGVYFWHNTFWRLDHSSSLINVLFWFSIGKVTRF